MNGSVGGQGHPRHAASGPQGGPAERCCVIILLQLIEGQRHPREGWAEAAKALAEAGEGELAWPDHDLAGDDDWSW